jgi:hypothetical protein
VERSARVFVCSAYADLHHAALEEMALDDSDSPQTETWIASSLRFSQ